MQSALCLKLTRPTQNYGATLRAVMHKNSKTIPNIVAYIITLFQTKTNSTTLLLTPCISVTKITTPVDTTPLKVIYPTPHHCNVQIHNTCHQQNISNNPYKSSTVTMQLKQSNTFQHPLALTSKPDFHLHSVGQGHVNTTYHFLLNRLISIYMDSTLLCGISRCSVTAR